MCSFGAYIPRRTISYFIEFEVRADSKISMVALLLSVHEINATGFVPSLPDNIELKIIN